MVKAKTIGKSKQPAKPTRKNRGTAKTAVAAVVKPTSKAKAISVFHTTERYSMYGKHVNDTTTRKIELRHELEKHLATGKATLGSIIATYGSGEAMLRTAKLMLRGLVSVAGVSAPKIEKQSELWAPGRVWKQTLAKLATSKPTTAVKLIEQPKHVSVMR